MTPFLRSTAVFAFFGLFSPLLAHAQHTAMPAGITHEQHMAQMKKEHATGDPVGLRRQPDRRAQLLEPLGPKSAYSVIGWTRSA